MDVKLLRDTQKIIEKFIQTRVEEAGADGVVIGLSGGIDSATTLSLAASALGNEKVMGLILSMGYLKIGTIRNKANIPRKELFLKLKVEYL